MVWSGRSWSFATASTLVNAILRIMNIKCANIYLFIANGGLSDSALGGMNWGGWFGGGWWWPLFLAAENGGELINTLGGEREERDDVLPHGGTLIWLGWRHRGIRFCFWGVRVIDLRPKLIYTCILILDSSSLLGFYCLGRGQCFSTFSLRWVGINWD